MTEPMKSPEDFTEDELIWIKPLREILKDNGVSCTKGSLYLMSVIHNYYLKFIEAERTSRVCYAMELEPVFCDVAVKRWEEFTGRTAELVFSNE